MAEKGKKPTEGVRRVIGGYVPSTPPKGKKRGAVPPPPPPPPKNKKS